MVVNSLRNSLSVQSEEAIIFLLMHFMKNEKDIDVKTYLANLLGHLLKYHITIH